MNKEEQLTLRQTETLRGVVDRIIPADDFPGGWEAGVGDFYVQLFAREPRFLPVYRQCLDALEREAQAAFGTSFVDLDPVRQDALLARVEIGDVHTNWPHEAAAFFRLLVEQTTEGFYADPGNGGNKDEVAWEMIGYRVTA